MKKKNEVVEETKKEVKTKATSEKKVKKINKVTKK